VAPVVVDDDAAVRQPRQGDLRAAAADLVGVLVELEVLEGKPPGLRLRESRAAEDRPDARDQLLQAERLGDVVVAADRRPADLVLGGVARGQEGDGTRACWAPSRLATSKPSTSGSITSSRMICGRKPETVATRVGSRAGRGDLEALGSARPW
jgi:hypothetical protein